MSKQIIIDLTQAIADGNKIFDYRGKIVLDGLLLSYPSAEFSGASVNLEYQFTEPDVSVWGEILCTVRGVCDRCNTDTVKTFVFLFDQTFYKEDGVETEYGFSGSLLDITKAISDEVALSLPTSFLCGDDCKGLCSKCGANLNANSCDCDTSRGNVFSALKDLKF